MRTRRLALCQVKTRADRQTTLLAAETMVRQAAEAGADLAVLPEMFFCPYAAGCRIGLAICFDLRFPELIRAMAVRGAVIIRDSLNYVGSEGNGSLR